MKIARVFPRCTNATPTDELAFINCQPPMLVLPEIDEVHVSVAFSWDIPRAGQLAEEWMATGVHVLIGGPAFAKPSDEFIPGRYVKYGFTITSRGCPNRCWFCSVPQREGNLRELPIADGWNVLDDNLLACSDKHIEAVFKMLNRQPRRAEFTGGLEAKLLKPWHATRLREIRARRMYFAYDTPDDLEPLICAGKLLQAEGFKVSHHSMACYVLIGYPGDTFDKAERRLNETIQAGFYPYAMLFRNKNNETDIQWRRFQREWLLPQIVGTKTAKVWGV